MKSRKAFTLMELLVVIAIIGILMVFLAPKLLGVRDRAKETAVKSIMHTVQLAVEAYELENMTYPIANNIGLESFANNYLIKGGYLSSVPKNPFTGQPYKDSDSAGKIVYNYDSSTGRYTITGYNRSGKRKIQELTNL